MNLLKRFISGLIMAGAVLGATAFGGEEVQAAAGQIYFSQELYEAEVEEEMQVTVIVDCEEQPGTYMVDLVYDDDRMIYLSGADVGGAGTIRLQGTAVGTKVEYVITFLPTSGGNAGIFVSDASITTIDKQELMEIPMMGTAAIVIAGEDTTGKLPFSYSNKTAVAGGVDVPVVGTAILPDGSECGIVNIDELVPEECDFTYSTKTESVGNKDITVMTDSKGILSLVYLVNSDGEYALYSYGQDSELFPCMESDEFYYMSAYASKAWPSELMEEQIEQDHVFVVFTKDGNLKFCREGKKGTIIGWNEEEIEEEEVPEARTLLGKRGLLVEYSGIIILAVVILLWVFGKMIASARRKAKLKKLAKEHPISEIPAEDAWKNSEFAKQESDRETAEALEISVEEFVSPKNGENSDNSTDSSIEEMICELDEVLTALELDNDK